MDDMFDDDVVRTAAPSGKRKKLSVERIYQKKSQLEHILLRPDTYIGSVEKITQVGITGGKDNFFNYYFYQPVIDLS